MTRNGARAIGGIEAGGTKFVCAVAQRSDGTGGLPILERSVRIPTGDDPAPTLGAVVEFFRAGPRLAALGLGSFGPIDIDPRSRHCGRLGNTPKPGWRGADVAGTLAREFGVPVYFHTDVVAAALGEWLHGAARGARNVLYLTVGTGIGGGALASGAPIHGWQHAEMGHMRVARARGDRFPGSCPFHGDCLEGLASGSALAARGVPARTDPRRQPHPAEAWCADYVAQGIANLTLTLMPDAVVLGGGVTRLPRFHARVRERFAAALGGYLGKPWAAPRTYIRKPGLGARAGVIGAIALATSMRSVAVEARR